jgi:hypothetical protein
LLTRITDQFVTLLAHLRPLLIALKLNSRRHGEVSGNIAQHD